MIAPSRSSFPSEVLQTERVMEARMGRNGAGKSKKPDTV